MFFSEKSFITAFGLIFLVLIIFGFCGGWLFAKRKFSLFIILIFLTLFFYSTAPFSLVEKFSNRIELLTTLKNQQEEKLELFLNMTPGAYKISDIFKPDYYYLLSDTMICVFIETTIGVMEILVPQNQWRAGKLSPGNWIMVTYEKQLGGLKKKIIVCKNELNNATM